MSKATAIYARYSSHAQDGGTSIEVQLDACGRGLAPGSVREYVDRARSGRSMVGREALLRLLADAEAGQIDRVLVYKYDRLGRNLAETSAIIAQLEDSGLEVVSVTEGKDQLARGVQLVVAEHYSRALAERTRDGLMQRFKQHASTGGPPPYGYQAVEENGTKRLRVSEPEVAIVRGIFGDYLGGKGFKEIAHDLHRRGVPTRRGGPWTFASVRAILRNLVYTGKVSFNRRRFKLSRKTGHRVPEWRDEGDVMSWEDESLRIIGADDHAEVLRRFADRARPESRPRASNSIRPFTGLIYCENGHRCYSRQSRNAKGNYYYYACGVRQRTSKDVCDNAAVVREDLLVRDITHTFGEVFADAEGIIAEATAEAERMVGSSREESARVKCQLVEIDREIAALTRLLIDPDFDATAKKALGRQMSELETRREGLHGAVGEMLEEANGTTDGLAQAMRQAFAEAREAFSTAATPLEMHEFVEQIVGPLTLQRDGTVVPGSKSRPR